MATNETVETTILPNADSHAIEVFNDLISKVPEAGENPYDSIILQIADAKKLEDLDRPWLSDSLSKLDGKEILINSIRKSESSFDEGFGYFLIIDYVDKETGESAVASTGAVAVVIQLVKAFQLGLFPLSCIVKKADRPSKNGFFPVHLIFNY
jgi:hypothetical protein